MDIKTANVINTIESRINKYLYDSEFKIRKQKTEIFKETDDNKVRVCIWIEFRDEYSKMSERTKSSENWNELKRLKKLINEDTELPDSVRGGIVSSSYSHLQVIYPLE